MPLPFFKGVSGAGVNPHEGGHEVVDDAGNSQTVLIVRHEGCALIHGFLEDVVVKERVQAVADGQRGGPAPSIDDEKQRIRTMLFFERTLGNAAVEKPVSELAGIDSLREAEEAGVDGDLRKPPFKAFDRPVGLFPHFCREHLLRVDVAGQGRRFEGKAGEAGRRRESAVRTGVNERRQRRVASRAMSLSRFEDGGRCWHVDGTFLFNPLMALSKKA